MKSIALLLIAKNTTFCMMLLVHQVASLIKKIKSSTTESLVILKKSICEKSVALFIETKSVIFRTRPL